jgi:hypothetical protein
MLFKRLLPVSLLFFGIALPLAACDTTPQPSVPTPTGVVPVPEDGATISFSTVGGVAGLNRQLVIGPDASAVLTDSTVVFGPVPLPQERRDQMRAQIEAVRFRELPDRYGTGSTSDDIVKTLVVTDGDGTKAVAVEQIGGADSTPAEVLALFTLMDEIELEVLRLATTTPTVPPDTYVGTITYTTTREVDNRNWSMTILPSGMAAVRDGERELGTVQLTDDQMKTTRAMLEKADFMNMKIYYGSGHPHPEGFVDRISIDTAATSKTVTMERVASFSEASSTQRALYDWMRDMLAGERMKLLGEETPAP